MVELREVQTPLPGSNLTIRVSPDNQGGDPAVVPQAVLLACKPKEGADKAII